MHCVLLSLLLLFISKARALFLPQQLQLKNPPTRCRHRCHCSSSTVPPTDRGGKEVKDVVVVPAVPLASVPILPARQPLPSFIISARSEKNKEECFSLLSWNILLPNSQDNWWCHKQYSSSVAMDKRTWKHRQSLIKERLLHSAADIVCIQEADGDTFEADFDFMKNNK